MKQIKRVCDFMSSNIALLIIIFFGNCFLLSEGIFLGDELYDPVLGSGHVWDGIDDQDPGLQDCFHQA